ncbi:hypothetical protein K4L44_13885 [Halosquirtibacter laminarini]|uniref:Uncharacterized protein n=1 Tax=Halosquirtibacter laminarini TaxID=3374600 RepID=A0AC61NQY3_9BACT|nr:hypothetical protein K4L44_13885 [Prolixibacteraceae bacterium]
MIKQIFQKIQSSINHLIELEIVAIILYFGFIFTVKTLNFFDLFNPIIRIVISIVISALLQFIYSRFRDITLSHFENQMARTTASRVGIVFKFIIILLLILLFWLFWVFSPIILILLSMIPFFLFYIDKDQY